MTEGTTNVAAEILLSREELLYVLTVLDSPFLPGLDADPNGDLSQEQQDLALAIAERALRARQLVRIEPDGTVQLQRQLLAMVGTCAYAVRTIFVYHWPSGSETPTRTFCHVRGENAVVHTRPDDVIHRFVLLASADHLVDEVLAACAYANRPVTTPQQGAVATHAFAQARQLADAGDPTQAAEVLAQGGGGELAVPLAETLGHTPQVAIMQMVRQQGQTVEKRDLTLLQNGKAAWLIEATEDTEEAHLTVKTAVDDELRTLIGGWL